MVEETSPNKRGITRNSDGITNDNMRMKVGKKSAPR